MRHGTAVFAAGLLLAGCYVSHPQIGGPTPRDAGPPPRFDSDIPPLDGFVPPRDSDVPPFDGFVPPFDGFVPPLDGFVPPLDGDIPPPDAMPFDAFRPDTGPRDAGPPAPALRMSTTTFMEVEDSPVFDTVFDNAFELWVRSRETGDADFCQKGDRSARHLFAGLRGGRIVMGWDVFPTPHHVTGPVLVPGVWTHIALIAQEQSGGLHTQELYVNGTRMDRQTDVPDYVRAINDVELICGNADFDVDEIRVWRVARSQTQISLNMRSRISGSIPGMVAYWRLDEAGQIALDYTASGNFGILGRLTTADPADPTWILDGPF